MFIYSQLLNVQLPDMLFVTKINPEFPGRFYYYSQMSEIWRIIPPKALYIKMGIYREKYSELQRTSG